MAVNFYIVDLQMELFEAALYPSTRRRAILNLVRLIVRNLNTIVWVHALLLFHCPTIRTESASIAS